MDTHQTKIKGQTANLQESKQNKEKTGQQVQFTNTGQCNKQKQGYETY